MKEKFVQMELAYDCLTPVLVYNAVGGKGSCLLESSPISGEDGYSMIGVRPVGTLRVKNRQIDIELYGKRRRYDGDPYEALREFSHGRKAFGFVGYNAIRLKESIPDRHPQGTFPDFLFRIYQTIITFLHKERKIVCVHEGSCEDLNELLAACFKPALLRPLTVSKKMQFLPDVSREDFVSMVEDAKKYIRSGDIFQVVLSRTLRSNIRAAPFDVYRALRQVSPSPYQFFFEEDEFAIAGASPELMISVQEGKIESMPIAGTCTKEESGQGLLESSKELSEHIMLVDLARNDVGALSKAGSVQVAEYMSVKSFSHVRHIVSRVVGVMESFAHPLDVFKVSFPAGTLSGAPKIRAMEIIDLLEKSRRDLYGGAIVSLDENGNLRSCIAIRTAFMRGSTVEIRVGAGIVLDSDAQKEAEETEHKARGVVAAVELAEGGL